MSDKDLAVSNTNYNLTKHLTRCLQLLWNIGRYIEDAEKDGDEVTAKLWREVKAVSETQTKNIKQRIDELVNAGKY